MDCSLCHILKADLLALQPEIGFVLLEKEIDQAREACLEKSNLEESTRMERYRNLLPVLDIEHGAILYSPFSYDELFAAIDNAVEQSKALSNDSMSGSL